MSKLFLQKDKRASVKSSFKMFLQKSAQLGIHPRYEPNKAGVLEFPLSPTAGPDADGLHVTHSGICECVCFSDHRKHTRMTCPQRKHLDFLEIHSVRDVLVNKLQLSALDSSCKKLFISLLYCFLCHAFRFPTLRGVEIRVSSYCCLSSFQNVSHFTFK